jgi:hypothetical protein
MKDKRTYINKKEHGEDMSLENEISITHSPKEKEDRGALDLSYLIESHKKEIWEYQKRESLYIKTNNELKNAKEIIRELSEKIVEQLAIIAKLESEKKK